ncbi:hypothetical protein BU16DRAFT_121413 [Lophium mytilinum]|uniref:histone deacetylase n=1 Tax=Lophium mytilinum TaxID=390894 RepID=A0A6A6QIQ9_9PEZI|nr:hypothetical protein BU16DRAFT_121413 [Lophium mytilinum]
MDDPDFLMGDDTVIGSTELNGDAQTVDPSVLVMDTSTHETSPRKEDLPILSYQNLATASSPPNMLADHDLVQHDELMYSTDPSSSPPQATSEESPETTAPMEVQVLVNAPPPPRSSALPRSTLRSGLVFDARMKLHMEPEAGDHPEKPQRIQAIWDTLYRAGLVQQFGNPVESPDRLWNIEARAAVKAEVTTVHSKEHWKFIRSLQGRTMQELKDMGDARDSIYFNLQTLDSATVAAGGAIEACKLVALDKLKNAIALIRPPGHHAEQSEPSGFCIFNNVAIAAKVCQTQLPEFCRKVMILDWDVHHGNGIQHAFYDNPNVLYISLHVYKNGMFYPNGPDGDHLHCGEGAGEGRNVNIPWIDHGMGDHDYLYAFEEIVIPIAREFNPDLVIVAAGFDAAEGDELGGCHVSPPGYAHMTHKLMELAEGRVAVCLEGGYNLDSISKSALAVTKTLMGEPPDRLPGQDEDAFDTAPQSNASKLGAATVELVKKQQAKWWHCMRQKQPPGPRLTPQSVQMHDLVKSWRNMLFDREYGMQTMAIDRNVLHECFEDNVLVSDNFFEPVSRPLLVIFHDPPGYDVVNDPTNEVLQNELHNSWLVSHECRDVLKIPLTVNHKTDGTKSYVDWAHKHDFAIADINIPKVMEDWPDPGDTSERARSVLREDRGDYQPARPLEDRAIATREIAKYLWENFIEIGEFSDVFMMGIGDASSGLVEFLGTQESVNADESPLRHVFTFLAESPLRSIKRATDDYIGTWYYNHSHVYINHKHHVWQYQRMRKLRKKYGKTIQSQFETIGQMLEEARDNVIRILLEETEDWRAEQKQLLKLKSAPAALRLEERDMRASSAPGAVRSPGMPPIGMFSVTSPSPRSPAKRA